jgi:carbamoyl-phosphate synthase large subunit
VLSHKFTVLLTSAGGAMVVSMIEQLRDWHGFDIGIVTVDAGADTVGVLFADAHFQVGRGDAPGYAQELLSLCKANNVDVVVPLSDEEALALSEMAQQFSDNGIRVLGSGADATRRAANKANFLKVLTKNNLPVPGYAMPRSADDLTGAVERLGFPSNRVVCKPVGQRGGRGFRILSSAFDEIGQILLSQRELYLSLERLQQALKQTDEMPEFLVMEYLDGTDYSVDVLVENGACQQIIAQQKIISDDGRIVATKIISDPRIDTVVEGIVAVFDFDFLINIDMAERRADGAILPYEVNVRPSALVTGTAITGVALLREAICQAMGIDGTTLTPSFEGQIQYMRQSFV